MALRNAASLVIAVSLVRVAAAQPADPAPAPAPEAPAAPAAPAKKLTPKQAKAEAKKHIAEGTKLYSIQQYAQAADEYQQAYLLDPRPEYLYASAQSQRLGGDCEKALLSYQAYIRTSPKDAERDKAQKNIDRCQQELKDKEAAVQATAIEQQPPVDVPPPPPPPPPEPEKKVEVVPRPPPPPPPAPTKSYLPGHLMLGAGLVVIAGGVYLYRDGHDAIAQHNSVTSYDEFLAGRADADSAKQRQSLGVIGIVGGTALVGGAVAYYVLHARSDAETPTVSASVGHGHAGIVLTKAF